MDTEDYEGPPKLFLLSLGGVMAVVGILVVASLVIPIQPTLGGGGTPPPVTGRSVVNIPAGTGADLSKNYAPATITVILGKNNTVTWVNQDTAIHTATATDKSFDSGNIVAGGNWSMTFNTAGTYSYYCTYHSWMKGTVVVKAASGSSANGVQVTMTSGSSLPSGAPGYKPDSIVVVIGVNNTVTWTNDDTGEVHTAVADNLNFNSMNVQPGGSFTFTFTTPGTFTYHCIYHSWMKGTIIVKA